jgi:SAM-dependent methyltransferase
MLRNLKTLAANALDLVGGSATAYDAYHRLKYSASISMRAKNRAYFPTGPDGLPSPPPNLVFLISGSHSLENYYRQGAAGAESITSILRHEQLEMGQFGRVLDFGCGCGRVLRQWHSFGATEFHGTDINSAQVEWCARHLEFARFGKNELAPPTQYEDNQFNFIYAISVLTHLSSDLQIGWMREWERILAPGGVLLITVHGESRRASLNPSDQREFDRGEMIIRRSQYDGHNLCHTYHPDRYVRSTLVGNLDVLSYHPAGAADANQDAYLVRKR